MSGPPTPEERRAAIETMFRMRAVESPADKSTGLRTVWHRGALNAELVSEVDAEGQSVRHQLMLYGEVLVWERGQGLSTGEAQAGGTPGEAPGVALDPAVDPGRVARACEALRAYDGSDRVLLHLRELLLAGEQGRPPAADVRAATTSPRLDPVEAAERPPRLPRVLPWLLLGLSLIAAALALLELR